MFRPGTFLRQLAGFDADGCSGRRVDRLGQRDPLRGGPAWVGRSSGGRWPRGLPFTMTSTLLIPEANGKNYVPTARTQCRCRDIERPMRSVSHNGDETGPRSRQDDLAAIRGHFLDAESRVEVEGAVWLPYRAPRCVEAARLSL